MPTEPGVYWDARGDLWLLHDDGGWQHAARRMNDGQLLPVRDYPGTVSGPALEALAREPGIELLPLTRFEVESFPPEIGLDP